MSGLCELIEMLLNAKYVQSTLNNVKIQVEYYRYA